MKSAHESYVNSQLSNSVTENQHVYFCNYAKVKQKLKNKYAIDYKKKEVEHIGELFSCQNINVRIVMKKILDVMHRNEEYIRYKECGAIYMLNVFYELDIEISTLASLLQYLEMNYLIEECKHSSNDLNSWIEDENGNLIDVSKNYIYKIHNGVWTVTQKGMVLDVIYSEQNSL